MSEDSGVPKVKKSKRMCYYNKIWEIRYPWLSFCEFDRTRARCNLCVSHFTVGYDGFQAVTKHASTRKHEKALLTFSGPNPFAVKTEEEEIEQQKDIFNDKISVAELVYFYHGVKHNISYHAQDCSLKVLKQTVSDSEIVKKMTGGRTKNSAIVNQVLYPFAMDLVLNDLRKEIPFSISIDAQNKKHKKFYPVTVQYFTVETGICLRVLDFFDNNFEDAQSVKEEICLILHKNNLSWSNVTGYSLEHSCLNFDVNNLVYQKIIEEENSAIVPLYCYTRILNSCAKNSLKVISFDLENFILKIFSEISDANNVPDEFKEILDYFEKDFREIIRELPHKWLNLIKPLKKIVENWSEIKKYFISLGNKNCSYIIWALISDQECQISSIVKPTFSELYLYFTHHFMTLLYEILIQMERKTITVMDIHEILSKCHENLTRSINDNYFGIKVQFALTKNYFSSELVEKFTNEAKEVYFRAISFLEENFESVNYKIFSCLNLDLKSPNFDDLILILTQFKNDILPDELYNELIRFGQILPTLTGNSLDKWQNFFNMESAPNLLKIIQYVLSLPVSNGFVEKVFGVMGNVLTDERNRLCLESVKCGLCVYFNVPYTCMEFRDAMVGNKDVLKATVSTNKYKVY